MKAGWEIKPLGEVCTLQRGFDLPTHERTKGRFPLVTSSGISDTHNEGPVIGPGVVTGRSGSIGSVFYIDDSFWPLNTTLYVRDFHGNLPRFVFYLLTAFDLKKYAGGTGVPTLNRNDVHSVAVAVPRELPEQKRIVTLLDEAFAHIATAKANAEQNLQNARALFESHLQSVFTQQSNGWIDRSLKEICEKITDGTHQTPTYFDEGVIFLSSRNVTSGKIDWSKIKYIDEKQHLEMHRRVAPRKGDILLAKNGTTGVAAMVDRDTIFDIYVSLALLRALPVIRADFLLYFINSPVAKSQFNKRLKGVGVPNLHLEEIREVRISFPAEQAEQHRILMHLNALSAETQRLESPYQQKLSALDALKKSLLHQAFSGQL
jgi:type I restriction enzyme, S subunit